MQYFEALNRIADYRGKLANTDAVKQSVINSKLENQIKTDEFNRTKGFRESLRSAYETGSPDSVYDLLFQHPEKINEVYGLYQSLGNKTQKNFSNAIDRSLLALDSNNSERAVGSLYALGDSLAASGNNEDAEEVKSLAQTLSSSIANQDTNAINNIKDQLNTIRSIISPEFERKKLERELAIQKAENDRIKTASDQLTALTYAQDVAQKEGLQQLKGEQKTQEQVLGSELNKEEAKFKTKQKLIEDGQSQITKISDESAKAINSLRQLDTALTNIKGIPNAEYEDGLQGIVQSFYRNMTGNQDQLDFTKMTAQQAMIDFIIPTLSELVPASDSDVQMLLRATADKFKNKEFTIKWLENAQNALKSRLISNRFRSAFIDANGGRSGPAFTDIIVKFDTGTDKGITNVRVPKGTDPLVLSEVIRKSIMPNISGQGEKQ